MQINPLESISELAKSASPHLLFGIGVDHKSSSNEQLFLSMYNSVQTSIFIVDVLEDGDFCYLALNPTHERYIGIPSAELRGKKPEDILSPEDARRVRQRYTDCVIFGKAISYEQCLLFQGITTWWNTTLTPLRDVNSRIYRLIGTSTNITHSKQVEQAGGVKAERERFLDQITRQISLNYQYLPEILREIAPEIRQLLDCDRFLIYQFHSRETGLILAESSGNTVSSLRSQEITHLVFDDEQQEHYKLGYVPIIEDIFATGLHPHQRDFFNSIQVRAYVVVPILRQHNLWGLLISQHCHKPHQWEQGEIDLLKQLAVQISIATHQAEMHQQIIHLQTQLEVERQKHHTQLQQIENFAALIQRMTEQIRDCLLATPILETATLELVKLLELERCQIELYNGKRTSATVTTEYSLNLSNYPGQVRQIGDFPQIYDQLLQKKPFYSVEIVPGWHPQLQICAQLACPIFDAEGILGNLWVIKHTESIFTELEISLVQQVANECAIALRQFHLSEKIQNQVKELEQRERLKNEFLKTLAQELQTPMTSISLVAQTLEGLVNPDDLHLIPQLLQILQQECGRESKLINDLLTLAYLKIEPASPTLITIDLKTWLRPIGESFRDVTSLQKQELKLHIQENLPTLDTDITDLERIISELMHHACKCTPSGGGITLSAAGNLQKIELKVSSKGLEYSPEELSQIFQPFYRLTKNAPWKSQESGLELTLVKTMVNRLGGSIEVEKADNQIIFSIKFPIS
jgi:PAS domain S-box-containing protein